MQIRWCHLKFSSVFPSLPSHFYKTRWGGEGYHPSPPSSFLVFTLSLPKPFENKLKISWYLSLNISACFPENKGILFHSHNAMTTPKNITDNSTSNIQPTFIVPCYPWRFFMAVPHPPSVRIQLRYTHCSCYVSSGYFNLELCCLIW